MLDLVRPYTRTLFWGILLLALSLRLLLLWQYVLYDPFAVVPILDAQVYHQWAQTIAQGDWLGQEAFHQAPLYPYFLALLYSLFGPHLVVVYLAQLLLSVASAFLLYQLGRDFFDREVGQVAALLSLWFGFYAFYSLKLLPVTLTLFLTLLLLKQLWRSVQLFTLWNWFWSGLLSGFTILAHPSLFLFWGVLVLWISLRAEQKGLRLRSGAIFLLGTLLVLAPVTLRNFLFEKDFILVSTNGGETFYQGTNPQAQGTYTPITELSSNIVEQKVQSRRIAEEALGRRLSRREVSQYWWQQGLRYIQQHPFTYLRLLGKKLYLTLSGKDVSLIYFLHFEQERFLPLLRFFVLNQYLLLPFSLLGVLFWARKEHFVLLAFFGTQLSILLLFYVSTRYRLLLTPVILLFAAKTFVSLSPLLQNPQARRVFAVLSLLVIGSFVIDQRAPYARADQHYNLGIVYNTLGDHRRALAEFQEALQYRPTSPQILNNLGVTYYKLGQYQEAIGVWKLAKLFDASLPLLDYNLALAYQWIDQEQAEQQLRVYLESAKNIPTEQHHVLEARKRLQNLQEVRP